MSRGGALLQRARTSNGGWRMRELERLYRQYGFESEPGGKHILFKHSKYPQLWATVTNSSGELPTGYVATAVKRIDEALALEAQEAQRDK